ncbi:glycosyltransferase [Picosynechococcus sp. PCC 7003]|uniref:glycosyltransferase family 4 protein n=1 Tax=Picosynechococcus sp. PCC 7003 TaxID=374981 RepID=UPI000810E12C|nr:glycosyltransferase family 4 protein [Picosynechococcus sp. PCC 7003]ANV84739.1 glycosyltransferase [Picosynechococcus sp. PCC 7003]
MNSIKVLIFTDIPSPYQVELFNFIVEQIDLDLTIAYIQGQSPNRKWKNESLNHNHIILDNNFDKYQQLRNSASDFDLIIFGYYQHPEVLKIMRDRHKSKKPWCFWGEPPGYNYRRFSWLGKIYRYWKLNILHRSNAPIWGIGNWAVERYKKEFGNQRLYFNFPYFSNLDRFVALNEGKFKQRDTLKFLFSGSLIHRKGVDLLASAFARLAKEFDHIELILLGEGDLRQKLEQQLSPYSNQVKFLGFQPWEKLPEFYQQADIFCFPSRYDGWGLVVPEALASGLPVIGTDKTGSALQFIQNGYNGWLIEAGNEDCLYQAMRSAIELSTEKLDNYSDSAKQSISEHSLNDGLDKFQEYVVKTIKYFTNF